ncbi:alpha/beta-hydrolase [Schizophyllum commune Tattone D]|nr:alpha/beta-hydrolase [Schizophyllum commune Tattone D]
MIRILLGFSVLASYATSSSAIGGIALLFNNHGNWTSFADEPSALLFFDPATRRQAGSICADHGEQLLHIENVASFERYLAYYEYLDQPPPDQLLWADADNPVAPDGTNAILPTVANGRLDARLPFLCTNSAPHTHRVDTDFSDHPRTTVRSSGHEFTGTRDHLVFRFMGIPYAQPPTGSLRFKYPKEPEAKDTDATAFKPACLQNGFFRNNDYGLNPWGTSEDCLYLNVFTPYLPLKASSKAAKPVIFWIHGGGNTGGTGADATFDGGSLASRADVVVVTINHRLNIFGFLALADGVVIGNYALADKIAALKWVKAHIADFGGDPERVTIIGQSAGGSSVIDLVASPKAAGLFSRAVSMSGGAGTIKTPQEGEATAGPVIAEYCPGVNGTERLACLQNLPAETLLKMTETLSSWTTTDDGVYRIGSSVDRAASGAEGVNSVYYMAGFLPDEGQSLLGEAIEPDAKDLKDTLTKVVSEQTAEAVINSGLWKIDDKLTPYNATINVYTMQHLTCHAGEFITAAASSGAFPSIHVYNMHWAYALSYYDPYNLCTFPVGKPDTPYYKCHSGDLYEVFGTYYIFDQPVRTTEDIHHTVLVQDILGAFARTGNPNPDTRYLTVRGYESTLHAMGKWNWPAYTWEEPKVAALRYSTLAVEDGLPDRMRCKVLLEAA